MKVFLQVSFFFLLSNKLLSQCLFPVNFNLQKSIAANPFPNIHHYLHAERDTAASKPYLYVAAMEQGLIIYNISNIASPVQVSTLAPASFSNLYVMNLTQAGNYLYLALGDHFNQNAQNSGMAIVDISAPATPTIKSVWQFTATSGSGHVAVDGNYAFLAAMQNGIIVLNVTNKSNIQYVSTYTPNVNYPKVNPTNSEIDKINARSMVVKNNIMYLCYDAGGIRIINTTNKNALVQTGKYSNPTLLNKARAYNNLILDDSLLYVATDYAGMEILKVKDTANINLVSWWNPWQAGGVNNIWLNSPGHTNEIVFDKNCKMVFMSAGKTDVIAVSVANPLLPDSCSQFGTKVDSNGTWGIGRYGNQLYVTYIVTPIPFYSNWSGVKIVSYNACASGMDERTGEDKWKVYPNPARNKIFIDHGSSENVCIRISDLNGKTLYETVEKNTEGRSTCNLKDLKAGIYLLEIRMTEGVLREKILVED